MRAAFDALALRHGGGVTYLLNILPALVFLDQTLHCVVFVSHSSGLHKDLPSHPRIEVVPVRFPRPELPTRVAYQQLVLPRQLSKRNIALLYAMTDYTSFFLRTPYVLGVQNPNPWLPTRPSEHRPLKFSLIRLGTILSARRARRVVFMSEHARQSALHSSSMPAAQTTYIHYGFDSTRFNSQPHPSDPDILRKWLPDTEPGRYLLHISTLAKHKNHLRLLRAFGRSTLPSSGYQLAFVGQATDPTILASLKRAVADMDLTHAVRILGAIPNEELPSLYRLAAASVLPSLTESFGIPLIEAMACGTPVLASRAGAIPEVCGTAALYFDPLHERDITRSLERTVSDSRLIDQLTTEGFKQANSYSWELAAAQLLEVLQSSAHPPSPPF